MLLNEKRFTITMKELFLIRHGEAEHQVRGMTGGWTDTKLTELGKKQALKTGQKLKVTLKNKNFQMYSSDLNRASETAETIGKILNSPVLVNSDLREINSGLANNKTLKEAALLELPMTEPLLDWIPYPGGESWRMMKNRVYSFMNAINNDGHGTVIIVSHGMTMIVLVFWWLKLPEEAKISFEFSNCSITELNINERGERTIVKLNDTSHLVSLDY